MKIYKIRRPIDLKYTSFYFFLPDTVTKNMAHIIEHILVRRLLKEKIEIIDFNAVTTSDYIRIQIESPNITKVIKFFSSIQFRSNFKSEELRIALEEITQENQLTNNYINELLDLIRSQVGGSSDVEKILKLEDISTFLNEAYIVLIGDFSETVDNSELNRRSFPNEESKISYKAINSSLGNFTSRYLNLPIKSLPNRKSIYFIQQYVTQLNRSVQKLRGLGSYSSTAFMMFHRENLEIFLLATTTQANHLTISDKINRIIAEPYDINLIKSSQSNYYVYKEDITSLYLYPKYLEESKPILDVDNKTFLECIIKKFVTIDIKLI